MVTGARLTCFPVEGRPGGHLGPGGGAAILGTGQAIATERTQGEGPECCELRVVSFGIRIRLRVSRLDLLDGLAARLPPGWKLADGAAVDRAYWLAGGAGRCVLEVDGQPLVDGRDLEQVWHFFEADLQLYVAEMARRRVFVHAGAVGWDGQAIIIPGRSLSGKTTLVAALVRAGAVYYSDEYAVLDGRGRVHPYAGPLSIRQSDTEWPHRWPVEALGGRPGTAPLPVGLVLVSEYRRDGVWQPRALSAGRGALALLANTVSVRRQPAFALGVVQRVVRRARVLESARGEAAATAEALLQGL